MLELDVETNVNSDSGNVAAKEPPTRHLPRPKYSNLPRQRKELVGRQPELERTIEALGHSSIVSLIGPGGVGKTTLALEVGRNCYSFQKVVLCELAGSTQCTLTDVVLGAFDESAGNKEVTTAQLIERMGDGSFLLILDNCEHVIDSVAELCETLLDAKADLTILATSREPLDIDLEQVILLDGLDTNSNDSDAVVLFKMLASSSADLIIPDDELPLVRKIVGQLDGLPLGIELATPRLLVMSLLELHVALEDSMSILKKNRPSAARQSTMERTIAWSYELLTADEQKTLNELSVFKGLFTVEAVRTVATSDEAVSILHRLVEQSVVSRRTVDTGTYFRLLEPIRQFVTPKLEGETKALISDRYAAFFIQRVHVIAAGLRSEQKVIVHAQNLTREWRDIAASIAWKQDNRQYEEPIEAITDLGSNLLFQHRFEAFDWLEALVASFEDDIVNDPGTVALRALGIALYQRDLDGAEQLLFGVSQERDYTLEIAITWFFILMSKGDLKTLCHHCDDLCKLTLNPEHSLWCLVAESMRLSTYAMRDPHSADLDPMIEKVRTLETRCRWPLGLMWALLAQYVVAGGRNDVELADGLLAKITRRAREWNLSWFATTAGAFPRQPSDPIQHLTVIIKTMRSALEVDDQIQMPAILRTLFVTFVLSERMESAATIYGLIPQIKGFGDAASKALGFDEAFDTVSSSIPPHRLKALTDLGSEMTLNQALALAEEELAALQESNSSN